MSSITVLIRQPLLAGFGATLLLGLAACSASNDEPATSLVVPKVAEPKMKQEVLREEVDANAAYAPSVVAGALEARKAMPQSVPMIAPAPMADSAAFGYQDVYREQYQKIESSPVQAVAQQPVSTFSIDVDTGAYANVRRFLNDGSLPPKDAVRLEELVNYFPYAYPKPEGDVPFSVATELATTPWNPETRLLRVAIKAADLSAAELPPANLVFLVDVSGSMDRREGLPMVQSTLKLLVDQLRPQDRVALVTYAGNASVVLESTAGSEKSKIRAAIDQLTAGGSTAGESGIQLAYQEAQKGLLKGGINRILLATDGDFNVGISDFETLKQLAADKRKTGVSLTTLGFGTDNYNEQLMEQLADAGDGNYAYIDNLREARKVLVDQLSSTLAVVAKDVKIQVEFNPAEVSEYRLLGYENRALKREDFSNDKVDAGEIGAGHTVTALYEVVPVGAKGWLEPLRYAQVKEQGKAGEIAWLRLRYKAPEGGASKLVERPIAKNEATPIANASDDLRFAAAVAAFAQQLRDGQYTGNFSLADSAKLARGAKGEDPFGLRGEFVQLVELAQSLQTPQNVQVRAD
ncbi:MULTISPECIES: VWA domain-containing protein [unclassified Pseudomonas]|uniref:vWA domain-containing protein n=1 Tax=unclassified Pseudomonas TaxID=196821 RepID=UPI00244AC72C|nr:MULTISPECIES: VWA domain-containing protein [unclassified Pseudomonas]MDG9923688.1 VWA domain-containing protein [Pseudomonas sp. GD04045]MDH0036450.1 VWA domain-containing protein [Pseudomonas sp. GD04019]